MRTLDVLGTLFLVSIAADLFTLCLLVSSLFGSTKMPRPMALIIAALTWLYSYGLFYAFGTVAQSI